MEFKETNMDEIPSPSLLDNASEMESDIPIPILANPEEVLVSTRDGHIAHMKRTAESGGNPAKKRRLESDIETLENQQLTKEVEINLVQSKINDLELTIRRYQTSLREAQNEKLSLATVLETINTKIKTTKSQLRREKKLLGAM